MKKPIIIANWKMNPVSLGQAKKLFGAAESAAKRKKVKIVVCPPYPYLVPLQQMKKQLALGAQNCSWGAEGALTGEVSPLQLKNIGCSYVILNHSERKKYLVERLNMIQKKIAAARKAGLLVVLCVENAAELRTIKRKIKSFQNMVVVFEPSSAISTQGGKKITPENIAVMVEKMKRIAGRNVPLLYGGSVDAKSIGQIMERGKVQGALVGAASLQPREFLVLVKNAVFGKV
tara:strand:+ start:657 stop:1352 length:696 start_codon:yes stop_codon:yes gene_type:complete